MPSLTVACVSCAQNSEHRMLMLSSARLQGPSTFQIAPGKAFCNKQRLDGHRNSRPWRCRHRTCLRKVRAAGIGPEETNEIPLEQQKMSKELMMSMKDKIQDALDAENVVVTDINGDGRHVGIDVIASAFEGKSSVNRQRMVYKAIWLELQNAVHAVDAMTTKTPAEAAL